MALCPDETNLLAKAGCDLARSLLPAPFHLRFSNHDTGRQMTICAEGLDVWIGSVWHNSRYEFNDRGKIAGLQPDFEFARPIIDKFFDDVRQAVAERDKSAAEHPRVTERVEDCPECHETCGWCSWYRSAAREHGCGSQSPGRKRFRCQKAEALKGTICGTCDGSGKVTVRREILSAARGKEG